MKKSLFLLLFILFVTQLHSQNILCGRVIDEISGDPIQAKIFVGESKDFVRADSLGNFCITLDSSRVVYFFKPLYSVYKLNAHEKYTTIKMSLRNTYDYETSQKKSRSWMYTERESPLTGFSPSFSISYLDVNYREFESSLDSSLIDRLEIDYALKFELAGYAKRVYIGIGYGFMYWNPENGNTQSSTGHFSANLGFNVLNKKVILTPNIGYFSYKNRVKSESSTNTSLSDYLTNRGYDLKFKGYFIRSGLDMHFVVSESFHQYFLGFRVSYLHQIGNTVVKNGFGNKLSTNHNVDFGRLNIELVFTIFTN